MAQRILTPDRIDERLTMTYDEYLAWVDEDTHAEWVEGEVFVFMPIKGRHVEVVAFVFQLIGYFVARRRLGRSFTAPLRLLLRDGQAVREPDIAVLIAAHSERFTSNGIVGAADLIVEVLSSDSVTRDRRDKLREYAEAGVPEYLIVEGREGRRGVTLLRLHEEGYFLEVAPDAGGRLESLVIPGLWIDPTWFDEVPLPDPFEIGDAMLAGGARTERATSTPQV